MEKQLKKGLRVTALATNKSAGYESGWKGVVQRASQSWAVVRWSNGSETMVEPAEIEENLSVSDGDTDANAARGLAVAAMPPEMQIEHLSKQVKELQRENERLTHAYCKASEDANRYKGCVQDVYNRLGDSIALRNDKVAKARKKRDEATTELEAAKNRIAALEAILQTSGNKLALGQDVWINTGSKAPSLWKVVRYDHDSITLFSHVRDGSDYSMKLTPVPPMPPEGADKNISHE